MIAQIQKIESELNEYQNKMLTLKEKLNIEAKNNRIEELNCALSSGEIENQEIYLIELGRLSNLVNRYNSLEKDYEFLILLLEILKEEYNEEEAVTALECYNSFIKHFENLYISSMFSNKYDINNAIVTIKAGAGGTESQDFVQKISRAYTRYLENLGFKIKILNWLEGKVAGYKTITLEISGEYAYGYLKSENGIHRFIRLSPYNANNKRQTSFISVDVIPQFVYNEQTTDIKKSDLKIDTYLASGAGGQHLQKNDTAVRITHILTNIVVCCQSERSQLQNKEKALDILQSKLALLDRKKQKEIEEGLKGNAKASSFGNQIRSYVFDPYDLATDHRTGTKQSAVKTLNGDFNVFVLNYLATLKE